MRKAVISLCLLLGSFSLFSQEACPIVIFGEPGDVMVTCNPDLSASVSLRAEVKNLTSVFMNVFIECGPGGTKESGGAFGILSGQKVIVTGVCRYDTPAAPAPFLKVLGPGPAFTEICSPIALTIDPLPPCARECPEIQSLIIDIPECEEVDMSAGLWPVSVNANISNISGVNGFYQWNFGDGSPPVTISPLTPSAPAHTHNYVCPNTGDYFITLTLVGCPSQEFYSDTHTESINLPPCGCPDISAIATEINGCVVGFNAAVISACMDAITEYIWNFGDGNTQTTYPSDPGDPTQVEHTYDDSGSYPVTLTLAGVGSGCSFSATVEVTACSGGGDGDDEDDGCFFCFCGGLWCCLFWALFLLFVVAAIVALAVALCNPSNPWGWIFFGVALSALLAFAWLLISTCDVDVCTLLLGMAGSGFAGYAVVCGTNIVPCNSWLCQSTTIPGTGTQVDNLLIIDIAFLILVLLLCAVL